MATSETKDLCHLHNKELANWCENHEKGICEECRADHESCQTGQNNVDIGQNDSRKQVCESVVQVKSRIEERNGVLENDRIIAKSLVIQKCSFYKGKIDQTELNSLHDIEAKYKSRKSEYEKDLQICERLLHEGVVGDGELPGQRKSKDPPTSNNVSHNVTEKTLIESYLEDKCPQTILKFKMFGDFDKTMTDITSIGKAFLSRKKIASTSLESMEGPPDDRKNDPPPYDEVANVRTTNSLDKTRHEKKQEDVCIDTDGHSVEYVDLTTTPNCAPTLIQLCSSIKARIISDTQQCLISGVAFLRNNTLVLVDEANKKIKLFDSSFKIMSYRTLDDGNSPHGVTHAPNNDVAVSFPKSHRVAFYHADDLTVHQNCNVNERGECYDISSSLDYLFVVWKNFDSFDFIGVYNIELHRVNRIRIHSVGPLSVSLSSNTIYNRSSVLGKDKITSTDISGEILWRMTTPFLDTQMIGIAAIHSGLLISLGGIQFIDAETQRYKYLLEYPFSGNIAVSVDNRKLAMAHRNPFFARERETVSIYQIYYS